VKSIIHDGNAFRPFSAKATWTTTYVSVPGSPDATPNAVPSVWTVVVGGDGQLAFNPPRVGAAIGDIVSFQFHSKNHTATQSSFNSPCTELAAPLAGNTAVFDSGFQPSNDTGPFPTYNITVTTTSPQWFYCQQGNGAHCAAGMVFAINSVESSANNFAAFLAKAKATGSTAGSSTGNTTTSSNGVGRLAVSAGTSVGVLGALLSLLL
jgi:plastocyanin